MKKLMVVRCDVSRAVDEGLAAVVAGAPIPSYPTISKIAYLVRCENPLGHPEPRHRGSKDDTGYQTFEWGRF